MTPVFYFDVGSPYAYLTAERIETLFPKSLIWRPILLGALFKRFDVKSWAEAEDRPDHIREIERRAALYKLPPIKWIPEWPVNTLPAMRAAIYAESKGLMKPFVLQIFRAYFVEGKNIGELSVVLETAQKVGLAPKEVETAIQSSAIKETLKKYTEEAGNLGIDGVPTIYVGDKTFFGDDHVEEALGYFKSLPSIATS